MCIKLYIQVRFEKKNWQNTKYILIKTKQSNWKTDDYQTYQAACKCLWLQKLFCNKSISTSQWSSIIELSIIF